MRTLSPSLHQDNKAPLYAACRGGHQGIVQLLLEAGADVNKATSVSDVISLLWHCISKSHVQIVVRCA